ncbi:diguanylate cyclase (GGDEF) domain-containing protein [Ruminococcaceae bacterium YRB3002]|nr:diguanylate cyclase (GGDEF) domain-containing protein [Ruminococcaceae bacterium YRB3002]
MGRRLNIGFLIDDPNNYFTSQACKGAELAAKALDANLFIFPGHYIGKPDGRFESTEYEYQYNFIFDLPNENNVDILYVLMGTIGSRAEHDVQKAFVDGLPRVPIVTLFADIEGYPSVTFDNKSGLERALKHLIDRHGARRIGYVSGPATNKDAIERLNAFREIMTENGLEVSDDQIVYGDFTESSEDVVRDLLDKYNKPDAIMFANDSMALGGYHVIEERGMTPGKDILVVGFDDDIFAASMTPPLTTIEASSADLTYKAILGANDFISRRSMGNVEVDTYLVQRSSCGCKGLDIEDMKERLHIRGILKDDATFVTSLEKYLFGVFDDDENTTMIKVALELFCKRYVEFLKTGEHRDRVDRAFRDMVNADVLLYVNTERLFNVLQTLQSEGVNIMKESLRTVALDDMISEYYRILSLKGLNIISSNLSKRDRVSRLVNRQTGNIFIMSHDNEIPYNLLLDGLDSVGFRKSFLYMFQGNQKHLADDDWKMPKSILLQAYSDGEGVSVPSEELKLVRTELIFTNEFVNMDRRLTMVVFPLFVGEDIYGLIVNELDITDLNNIPVVGYQLSVSIKSLLMIEEQNKVKKELQSSLEKFMRDNSLLTKEAMSDELTGLYNRRGFLEYSQKAITDPVNKGKRALVCFADMDNLKMVNDKFGHDDGDFALRTIAEILKDAFRNTDIIGRLGGDEFVVFAVVGVENYEKIIKERIELITKSHNEAAGKPYPIEMSTGVFEFICSEDIDIYKMIDQADEKLYVEKMAKKAKNGSYR